MSRADDIDNPTMVVFDLDPGAPAGMTECAQIALMIHEALEPARPRDPAQDIGLEGHAALLAAQHRRTRRTTPRSFALALAQLMEKHHGDLVVTEQKKELRKGKVLIDWSQNAYFKTTICAYSLRARSASDVSRHRSRGTRSTTPRPARRCRSRPTRCSSGWSRWAISSRTPPPSNRNSRPPTNRSLVNPVLWHQIAPAWGAGSAGDEVLGLRVVADERAGGLLGLVLEAGLLADLDPEAAGVEQLGDLLVVLEVRAGGVAPRVAARRGTAGGTGRRSTGRPRRRSPTPRGCVGASTRRALRPSRHRARAGAGTPGSGSRRTARR